MDLSRTITREYRILLLQHKSHMILRMTGREQGFQRSPLHTKDLPILDIGIFILRLMMVLEYLSIGAEPLQIGQAADVIAVPVGEEGLVHGGFFVREDGL